MRIMKETEINQVAEKRRKVEVEVADKLGNLLYEKFAGIYKAFARELYLKVFIKAYEKHRSHFTSFLKKEVSYDMWQHTTHPQTIRGLDEICNDKCARVTHKLLLYMLSDLIRLTGEWLEESYKAKLDFMSATLEEKEDLKRLPTFQKQLKCPKCESLDLIPKQEGPVKSNFLCKSCGILFAVDTPMPPHRSRLSGSSPLPKPVAQQYWNIVKNLVRGIERWSLTPDSVIGAIDKTYGLPAGGDVSGTTTDSMCILETIGDLGDSPQLWALQLIALATLVHAGHHTIVECAYPLTRHKLIDYKIGFYSSLTPNEETELVKDFGKTLEQYDDKMPNVLLWEDSKKVVRTGKSSLSIVPSNRTKFGIEFDKDESNTLKKNFFKVRNAYSMCAGGPITSTKKAFNVLYSADKKIATKFLKTLMKTGNELEKVLGGEAYAWANDKSLIV